MTGLALSVAFCLVAVPQPLICTDPATGDKTPVKPAQVERAFKAARDLMRKRGVHILDLPPEMQDRRRRLPEDLIAKDWCVVRAHVVTLEGALVLAKIDQGFLSGKFSRVERWVRAGISDEKKKAEAQRMMATAAAQLADRKFGQANVLLNRVIAIVFGTSDLWALPAELPEPSETKIGATSGAGAIDPEEVKETCPALVKKGKVTADEFDAMLVKTGKLMDQRRVRLLDIKGGEQLRADLSSYHKLNALFPATRVLCALYKRVKEAEIDLGSCMKRFQAVNRLREKQGVPEAAKERFSELVRSATNRLANREFEPAHVDLEELLILMGALRQPSAELKSAP